jgi:glycosyltransferase involved in cell wall biosynthesis
METLKLLFTSTFYPPYHLGGDATHVKYLAEELVRRGHEVHVAHSLDAYRLKRKGMPAAVEPMEGIHVHPISSRIGWISPIWTYVSGISKPAERVIEKVRREEKLDIVHHHNISLLGRSMLDIPLPSLYTAHDYWLICPRSDLMFLGKTSCQQRRCGYCSLATGRPPQLWRGFGFDGKLRDLDQVISPSRFMASSLNKFLGIDSVVMPNFHEAPPSTPPHRSDEGHFVFAGVLESYKGIDLLIKVFERGKVKSPLHIMGRGSMEEMVRRASDSSGGRISYLGFVPEEERKRQIATAKAMVAPSTWNENGPLTCIEALSMATPLVVTNKGGLPELVEDPECGLVCDATVDGLERALLSIEGDPELQRRLSINASLRYSQHHTPERYLNDYLSLCKKIIS